MHRMFFMDGHNQPKQSPVVVNVLRNALTYMTGRPARWHRPCVRGQARLAAEGLVDRLDRDPCLGGDRRDGGWGEPVAQEQPPGTADCIWKCNPGTMLVRPRWPCRPTASWWPRGRRTP